MRILHLSNHIKNSGNGIVNVLVDLACAQADEGQIVAVASAGGEFEQLLKSHGVSCFRLDQTRRPLAFSQALIHFRSIIRAFHPDVLHAHMMTGALLAYLLRWKSEYRIVTSVHNEFQKSSWMMGVGDRVIAVSDAVERSMLTRGIAAHRLRTVRNGPLGSARKHGFSGPSLELQRPAIVTVAGMYVRKGIIPLLEAFARVLKEHHSAHLYIIGDGPDRAKFESKARDLKISHSVHFEGFQSHPERYLNAADIFVLASLAEPFGLVLAEAREANLAIVATKVGGIPEVLDGGEAGILVPPNDAAALARALGELLQNSDALARAKMRAGQGTEWLRVERMRQEMQAIYAEIVTQRE